MGLDLYNLTIDAPGLGVCIAGGYMLYKALKHFSLILITVGFFIIFLGSLSNNFCLGNLQTVGDLNDFPFLCHPITAYIRGLGYLLIGFGLIKLKNYVMVNKVAT